MKKTSLCIFMIFFSLSTIGHASQFVSSRISDVTLYSNQAMIVREGRANLAPGMNELLIETTAYAMDKDALSAQVFGSGEMISVQLKSIPLSEFPQEQVRSIQEKLRDMQRSRNILSDKKTVLAKQSSFLDSLIDFARTQIPKDVQTDYPKMADVRETLTFIGSTAGMIDTENQALDTAIEETDREIEKLRKALAAVQGKAGAAKQAIEILFKADKKESVRLKVQYLIKRASWQPLYKVAVPASLSELELTMLARIKQKSGEDWHNVGLSVSNVIPMKGVRLPELRPWNLDIPRSVPLMHKKSRTKGMMESPASMALEEDRQMDKPEIQAGYASAAVKELPLSFEYQMPFPVSIASRDQLSILPLLTKKISAKTFHYSVPALTSLTFLVAEAAADQELLAGKLNVYFGGRFIGDTFLAEKKPGQTFTMNLGADRGITVRREKILDKVKETYFGAIQRDTVVRSFSYKISVENIKESSAVLKIIDRIPVSRTDKIEVRDIKMQPMPTHSNYQDKAGVHLWSLQLDPGQKQEIAIDFTVAYPKALPPYGL
jgi:uncharacterized protein (TIGR02231 family)